MTSDDLTYVLVIAALAIAAVNVVVLARSRRAGPVVAAPGSHSSSGRSRSEAPIMVELDVSSAPTWVVAVKPGAASTSIDIVSFRPEGGGEWTAEPLIEPKIAPPGGTVRIPASITDATSVHDVVVGWTDLGPGGPTPASGTFRIGRGDDPTDPLVIVTEDTRSRIAPLLTVGVVLAAVVLSAAWVALPDDEPEADENQPLSAADYGSRSDGASSATSPPPAVATTAPATPSSARTDDPAPPTTEQPDDDVTTLSPTSVVATTEPTEPWIRLIGRVEDCEHGADCVIVGFELVGWTTYEDTYTCIFGDGTQYTFNFGGDGVTRACAASGPNPSIAIEVGGVRSETVTRASFPRSDG